MDKRICTAPGCTKAATSRYCSKHWARWYKYGSLDLPGRPSIEERFWAKVNKTDSCWLWTAATDRDGYGRFTPVLAVWYAHRYAYTITVGEIPGDLTIDHLCKTRNCVRPDHLEPVPVGVNTLRGDGPSAQQARQTHCRRRGHELPAYQPGKKRRCRECARMRYQRSAA